MNNFVGQEQILGVNAVLRKLLDHADVPPSLILWGPPGCGKVNIFILTHSIENENTLITKYETVWIFGRY